MNKYKFNRFLSPFSLKVRYQDEHHFLFFLSSLIYAFIRIKYYNFLHYLASRFSGISKLKLLIDEFLKPAVTSYTSDEILNSS